MLSGTRLQISQLLKTRNCRQLYTPRGRSPGLSLSGEELRGLSSNLTFFLFLSPWDFHSLVGRVPFFVVHSQARFHDSMMHACMNGNGPPSESPAIQPTLKLSEIVELASVPVPKCLLRTKYDNRSHRIPWDVHPWLSGLSTTQVSVSYDGTA